MKASATGNHGIMEVAGELDDRWLAVSLRLKDKPFGPAVLRVSGRKVRTPLRESEEGATRLVTPGDAARNGRVTDSATENKPPASAR